EIRRNSWTFASTSAAAGPPTRSWRGACSGSNGSCCSTTATGPQLGRRVSWVVRLARRTSPIMRELHRVSFHVLDDEKYAHVVELLGYRPGLFGHEGLHLLPGVIIQQYFVAQHGTVVPHLID